MHCGTDEMRQIGIGFIRGIGVIRGEKSSQERKK